MNICCIRQTEAGLEPALGFQTSAVLEKRRQKRRRAPEGTYDTDTDTENAGSGAGDSVICNTKHKQTFYCGSVSHRSTR